MEPKQTQFNYLYQNLKEQIRTGYLPFGTSLPSIHRLGETYNVGIRTVRDALNALKTDGLIQTEERKTAVVSFQHQNKDQMALTFQSVLEQKESILAVFKTMGLLMPQIFALSAQVCNDEKFQQCLWVYGRSTKSAGKGRWQASSVFLHDVLDASGNLLFRDMYSSLEIASHIIFFLDHADSLSYLRTNEFSKRSHWVIDVFKDRNPEIVMAQSSAMYSQIYPSISQYLDKLSQICPKSSKPRTPLYKWTAERGHNHYYTQITRDLINQIGIGVYDEGTFLPSEAQLAQKYNVSVSTVRKALAQLNELGFAHTYNVKGTKAIRSDDQATLNCMKKDRFKKNTLVYLSGLQLMAIAIRPAAELAFETLELKRLQEQFQESSAVPLNHLITAIISHTPLQPLRTILQEVNKLLIWGYYFSFYSKNSQSTNRLTFMSKKALKLLEQNNREGFSNQVSLCYCHILNVVRDFITDCGLLEAAGIISIVSSLLHSARNEDT